MVLNGVPISALVGNTSAMSVDLLFGQRTPSDSYGCQEWACELCRSFAEFDEYTLMASAFMLTRMMQVPRNLDIDVFDMG